MNAHTQTPPLDPFAPGVRAADVPVVRHDLSKPIFQMIVPPASLSALEPDREALATFSEAVFKNADPKGFVSLRAFLDDGKDGPTILIEPITIGNPAYLDVVVERARQAATWPAAAVFCPPVTTFLSGKDAKTENIREGVTLSVDCDASPVEARSALEAILGKPTIAVASGGEWINPETGEVERKCHLHWRLKETTKTPTDHALLKEARELATKLVGGDPTGVSLVHPFRWPGSWHRKKQPKFAEIVIDNSDTEIDLDEALTALREISGRSEPSSDKGSNGIVDAFRQQLAANPEHVALVLKEIPNKDLIWKEWNKFGLAAWGATGGSEIGFEAFAEWSAKAPKNDPLATRARWDHYKTSPPKSIGFGTLVYHARKANPGWTTAPIQADDSITDVVPIDLWERFSPPSLRPGMLPDVIERYAVAQGGATGADLDSAGRRPRLIQWPA
jgi:hypothetical protein